MPSVPPPVWISENDRQIISQASRILFEHLDPLGRRSNVPAGHAVLSEDEAKELAEKLQALAESRAFFQNAYFIETLTQPGLPQNETLRKIYMSHRARGGRSIIQSSYRWAGFLNRLGIASPSPSPQGPKVTPMTTPHFLKLEGELLRACKVPEPVVSLILASITARMGVVARMRDGSEPLKNGALSAIITGSTSRRESAWKAFRDGTVSKSRLIAIVTIVADTSVLFTTRDWDVTGVISGLAAAAIGLQEG